MLENMKGLKLPGCFKTGTTIAGVVFKVCIIISDFISP